MGKKYVGSTNNLVRRLKEHNSGRTKYTSMCDDWKMIYYREFETQSEAREFESRIKKNKKYRKEFYEEANI